MAEGKGTRSPQRSDGKGSDRLTRDWPKPPSWCASARAKEHAVLLASHRSPRPELPPNSQEPVFRGTAWSAVSSGCCCKCHLLSTRHSHSPLGIYCSSPQGLQGWYMPSTKQKGRSIHSSPPTTPVDHLVSQLRFNQKQ